MNNSLWHYSDLQAEGREFNAQSTRAIFEVRLKKYFTVYSYMRSSWLPSMENPLQRESRNQADAVIERTRVTGVVIGEPGIAVASTN